MGLNLSLLFGQGVQYLGLFHAAKLPVTPIFDYVRLLHKSAFFCFQETFWLLRQLVEATIHILLF